jgi:hypothetical protein
MKKLFGVLCLALPTTVFPHGGGTDVYGCHNQSSTETYHCHSGQFSGMTFSSRDAMLAALSGSSTPTPTPTATSTPSSSPSPSQHEAPIAYNRDLYQHWIDADDDCQDTRQEVLIEESVIPPLMSSNGCSVVTGLWNDPYTGRSFTNPSDLDIDHMIPLKEAHDSGAWAWSSELKRAFANDLKNKLVLIAVDDSTNQSKSDRDPAEWMPPNTSYHCQYVQDWVAVKRAYALSIDSQEQAKINTILAGRDASPMFRPGAKLTPAGNATSSAEFSIAAKSPGLCGYSTTASPSQKITLGAEFNPDSSHIGLGAELFVVIEVGGALFMRDQQGGFAPWDFSLSTLIPAARVTSLSSSHDLTIFSGALGLTGNLSIFLAYRTEAGEFVYSPTPAVLSVRQ